MEDLYGYKDFPQVWIKVAKTEITLGVNSIGYFALLKLGDLTQSCPSFSFVCLSPSRLLLGPNFG